MSDSTKINWYRCKVDRAVMSELMRKSDAKALAQVIPNLVIYATTGTLAFLAFRNVSSDNWPWSVPLVLLALFVHGTFARFHGGIAGHELSHKTPFATPWLNHVVMRTYAFISLFDYVGFRASHIRHHQSTVHADQDGEVVLPQGLDWHGIRFILKQLIIDPVRVWNMIRFWIAAAFGRTDRDGYFSAAWLSQVVPESNPKLRREYRNWARFMVFGHLTLAAIFIATGHWYLIIIFTFGCHYCGWFEALCGIPQHIGLAPNVNDFRLCCRTYTCSWLPAFCYWNMQYHIEHHMFPAVPFYNLPKLRAAIKDDLPPAPHGLWATWRELLPLMRRQREEPGYFFVPQVPQNAGDHADDATLLREAAQA